MKLLLNPSLITAIRVLVSMTFLCTGLLVSADLTDPDKERVNKTFEEHAADSAKAQLETFSVALKVLSDQTGSELRGFSITSTPPTVSGWMPFKFSPFDGITMDLLMTDPIASRGVSNNDYQSLISAFNIQVLTSNDDLIWPDEAQIVMRVEKWGDELEVQADLKREGSSYVFDDAFEAMQAVMGAVYRLDRMHANSKRKARLDVLHLTGFDEVISEATEMSYPTGIPVTYSLRLGDIRLSSNYVWLGRPTALLNVMAQPEFFK